MAHSPSTTAPPWRRRGGCLTAGVHTPGSQAALECPLRHAKGGRYRVARIRFEYRHEIDGFHDGFS